MALQSGTTSIPDWSSFDLNSLIVQVSYPQPFDATPAAVASLVCDTRAQPATAGIRIMNPSPVGFMAFLQLADGGQLTTDQAESYNWRVSWIASD